MASCPLNNHLQAYFDGELDESRRSELELHLRECPSCTEELARFQAMSRMIASVPSPRLSQIGLYRLHNQIDQAMEEGVLRIVRVLSAIAACVLVAGSAWLMRTRESRAVESSMPVAPPWADVVEASDSPSGAYSTPAAAWYLADDSARSEDSQ